MDFYAIVSIYYHKWQQNHIDCVPLLCKSEAATSSIALLPCLIVFMRITWALKIVSNHKAMPWIRCQKMSFFVRPCHCTSLTQPWRTVKKLTQEALLGQELLGWKKKDEKQKEKINKKSLKVLVVLLSEGEVS